MSTPIQTLVERFSDHIETYTKSDYNKIQTRIDFINPFFTALGWDVNNEQGLSEVYRQVIHEPALKVGQVLKMPDYSFRVGGVRKFFVEAKKPSVSLFDNPEPAYQLRRYGWNAKLSVSLVTNFAELAVYDCRIKPNQTDKAHVARLKYLRYTDYLTRWQELNQLFSFEAVWQGQLDQYINAQTTGKGVLEVDEAFLAEIEAWREQLAHQIAQDNQHLTPRQLNGVVQQTIDRIIFLRICEDKGIEDDGNLLKLLNGPQIYPRLFQLFLKADDRYNSGLFHFKAEKGRAEPDTLTPTLIVADELIANIIKHLYYPDSPYEFSVLPVDILGQVYERFLGKVIRLTQTHQVVVEEKPEVKKAGGVYYTPTYIVDYIVKQTVGKILERKKSQSNGRLNQLLGVGKNAVSRITICDPACGSGSFLLGAYQFLLDWHLEQYLQQPEKWLNEKKPRLYHARGGTLKLTTNERKRILLNNIYGVDIDPQAVEVTKLSLLLKVLENEQSVISQLSLFKERVLPDLDQQIKCGNSLIGQDFYHGQSMDLLDEDSWYQINAFDWETEFQPIFLNGGFDIVVGNPPYVRQELLGDSKAYLQQHYHTAHGLADLYIYFIEKGVSLLRENGLFGIIVANKWMRANYGQPLRQWLKQHRLIEITDFGDLLVFQQTTTYPCILTVQKAPKTDTVSVTKLKNLAFSDLATYVAENAYSVQHSSLNDDGWTLADTQALLEKLYQKGIPLNEYVKGKIYRGILTGLNEAFVIDAQTRAQLIAKDARSDEIIKPFLLGRNVKRYQPCQSERYLIFTRRGIDIQQYPAIKKHLLRFKNRLKPRPKNWQREQWQGRKPGSYQWYEIQDTIAYYQEFERPKIIIPTIVQKASYTFDDSGFYSNDKTSIIAVDDLYLLGLLNSKVLDFVLHSIAATKQGGYFEYKPMSVQKLPIRLIDFNQPKDKTNHKKMLKLVKQMLELQKKRAAALDSEAKNLLSRRIEATEQQIDHLVYQLYDLTPQEIEMVEKSSS
jgi:type I restriction-modification system DNA methylase subunit